MSSKMVYNAQYIGGELQIITEDAAPSPEGVELEPVARPVKITYWFNGEEITRHEAQALLDEAKRRAQH